MDKELIKNLYIRICKDSGFKLDYSEAAIMTAGVLDISPLEVWIAFGSFQIMEKISKNNHAVTESD